MEENPWLSLATHNIWVLQTKYKASVLLAHENFDGSNPQAYHANSQRLQKIRLNLIASHLSQLFNYDRNHHSLNSN